MRTSHYYGRLFGAKIVEVRRGTVSEAQTGTIDRDPVFQATTLSFNVTLPQVRAKRLAAELSAIIVSQAQKQITAEQAMDSIDQAICTL